MSQIINIRLTAIGGTTGPFDIYTDLDLVNPIYTGITKTDLLSGITITVPDGITYVKIVSTGICGTELILNLLTPTPSPSPTNTPTLTPTPTSSPTPTPTPSPTSTSTPTPSPSRTQVPTATLRPTQTPTVTPTPSPTILNTPTVTPTPSPTQFQISTPTPTPTSAVVSTSTPTPSPTQLQILTPTPTPTFTSPIIATSTPTPTPSPTQLNAITLTPTPTISLSQPTPTITPTSTRFPLTPTPTPTSTPAPTGPTPTLTNPPLPTCAPLYNTFNGDIYFYDVLNKISTLLVYSPKIESHDIAHTSNKLWIYDDFSLYEYDLVTSIFNATLNRVISLPLGFLPSKGLFAIDNNTLIMGDQLDDPTKIVEVNVSTNTPTVTFKFNLPTGRIVNGDFLLTTNNKFIISTQDLDNGAFISQYDYTTGTLEYDLNVTNQIPYPWGMFIYNSILYISTGNLGDIYQMDLNSPFNITYYDRTNRGWFGASQTRNCLNRGLEETPTPTPTQTPTPTPSSTPVPTPSPTLTPLPTPTSFIENCDPLYNTTSGNVYIYNVAGKYSTLVNVPQVINSYDIAHTRNKLWVYDTSNFIEYNITLNPWTASINRIFPWPNNFVPAKGLKAISDTILIVGEKSTNPIKIYELNVFNVPINVFPKFDLIVNREIYGDFTLTTSRKFIVLTKETVAPFRSFISQYDYNLSNNNLEWDVDITSSIPNPSALFIDNNKIFVVNNTGSIADIYNLGSMAPPFNITFYDNEYREWQGGSQLLDCALIPTPTPTVTPTVVGQSPTPTPTPTLFASPTPTPTVTPTCIINTTLYDCVNCTPVGLPYLTGTTIGFINGVRIITGFTETTYNNLTITSTYVGPEINSQNSTYELAGSINCTGKALPNKYIWLGYFSGGFDYTITFNKQLNNVKFLTFGGGKQGEPYFENYKFNTNSGVPTLNFCGDNCGSVIVNNDYYTEYAPISGGGALIQVTSVSSYSAITISGDGNYAQPVGTLDGTIFALCIDDIDCYPAPDSPCLSDCISTEGTPTFSGLPLNNQSLQYNNFTITGQSSGDVSSFYFTTLNNQHYYFCSTTENIIIPNDITTIVVGSVGPVSGSPFTYKMIFDRPVNNIGLYFLGMGAINENYGIEEEINVQVNQGCISLTLDERSCNIRISGDTIYGKALQFFNTSFSIGDGLISVNSTLDYTEITLTGPGGLYGTIIGICDNLCNPPVTSPCFSTCESFSGLPQPNLWTYYKNFYAQGNASGDWGYTTTSSQYLCNNPQSYLIPGGVTTIILGENNLPFTYEIIFDRPVNNVMLYLLDMGTSVNPYINVEEVLSITTNSGIVTLELDDKSCNTRISGNTVYGKSTGFTVNDAADSLVLVKSSSDFTKITLSGPGGLDGTVVGICDSLCEVVSIECLDNLIIEGIYLNENTDEDYLLPGYEHPCRSLIGNHNCSDALFELYIQDVFVGELKMNNYRDYNLLSYSGNTSSRGTLICKDFENVPTPISNTNNWIGSQLSRYSKVSITRNQLISIANNTNSNLLDLRLTGAFNPTTQRYNCNGITHESLTWIRITNESGELFYNGCPVNNFLKLNVNNIFCPTPTPTVTPTPTPSPTPIQTVVLEPTSCATCELYPLKYNFTGLTYYNLSITSNYNVTGITEQIIQNGAIQNCTNTIQVLTPSVALGHPSGNSNYTYNIKFNQPVNNMKFLFTGGGDPANLNTNPYEQHVFNTNNGTPVLSICGPSCGSRVRGNIFESQFPLDPNFSGAAIVEVKTPSPYTEITINGQGNQQQNYMGVSICLTKISSAPPTPTVGPTQTPTPTPTPSKTLYPTFTPTPTPFITPTPGPTSEINTLQYNTVFMSFSTSGGTINPFSGYSINTLFISFDSE